MSIQEKLLSIQSELKVPKSLYNKFGKFNYRSAELICETAKPLCLKYKCLLTMYDDVIAIGDRIYVKATVVLTDIEDPANSISVSAFAREEDEKKGMDGSQITGASSSYARKYALNGLFCIDDTKDSDATNDGSNDEEYYLGCAKQEISAAKTNEELMAIYNKYTNLQTNKKFLSELTAKRKSL